MLIRFPRSWQTPAGAADANNWFRNCRSQRAGWAVEHGSRREARLWWDRKMCRVAMHRGTNAPTRPVLDAPLQSQRCQHITVVGSEADKYILQAIVPSSEYALRVVQPSETYIAAFVLRVQLWVCRANGVLGHYHVVARPCMLSALQNRIGTPQPIGHSVKLH